MIQERSIIAIIPARGGSKRLPGKNIKPLGGLPLIAWSIESARSVAGLDYVLVTTDDEAIADVAAKHGASVPWLRPAALATDTATSADAIVHALETLKADGRNFDILVLLQPTTPFRNPDQIRRGIDLCIERGGAPVVSFGPAASHPWWCYKVDEQLAATPYLPDRVEGCRSQDLPPAYHINGSLYVMGTERFLSQRSFVGPDTAALIMAEKALNVDIDDELDWLLAESILKAGLYKKT